MEEWNVESFRNSHFLAHQLRSRESCASDTALSHNGCRIPFKASQGSETFSLNCYCWILIHVTRIPVKMCQRHLLFTSNFSSNCLPHFSLTARSNETKLIHYLLLILVTFTIPFAALTAKQFCLFFAHPWNTPTTSRMTENNIPNCIVP